MKIKKGYLNGPFGQIHYYQAGAGPDLILVHQSPLCARMFEKIMPILGELGIRVTAIDTPGYGNSDVPPSPPSIADYADIFPSVLEELSLDNAHFLGHHTGAAVLCSFAARYQEKVKSLILNGPPLFTAQDLEPYKGIVLGPDPIFKDGTHMLEAWNTRLKYSPGWTDEKAMHRRLVDQLWAGDTAWYGLNASFKYIMEPDFMVLTSRTLILTNTGDDIYELAKKARMLRPDFDYKELAGGTHDIVDEQPEAWSKLVADFVHNA